MILSAAEEVKKNLTAVVGGSITLPERLQDRGFLLLGLRNIAEVDESHFDVHEESYRNRLHWNKTSGLFTITDLQRSDSGLYKLDSRKGQVFTLSYNLMIYGESCFMKLKKKNS